MSDNDKVTIWGGIPRFGTTPTTGQAIAGGGDGFNFGRSSEILRDELMFSKFVGRLRKRFSNVFNDILRTQ